MKYASKQTAPLSVILKEMFPDSSGKRIKDMLKYGAIFCDGQVLKNPSILVKEGAIIEYQKKGAISRRRDFPFKILYEDDSLIAVEKPAGIVTIGKKGGGGTSVYREMKKYFEQKRERVALEVVHRLDYEVGGILLMAKVENLREKLHKHWDEVEKIYCALTEKVPSRQEGQIESWLKDGEDLVVRSFDSQVPGSKYAVTSYRVEKTMGGLGVLEVRLGTGRKNQIRVHLSKLGCPIVGDVKYGASRKVRRRLRLWAKQLTFVHPITKRKILIESKEPGNFFSISAASEVVSS